jgi:hypothetical protein
MSLRGVQLGSSSVFLRASPPGSSSHPPFPEVVLQGLYKAFRQTVCRRKVGRTCLVPDAVSLHELRQFFTRKLWTVVRYECDRQPIPNKDAA